MYNRKQRRASGAHQGEQETIRRFVSWGYSDSRVLFCLSSSQGSVNFKSTCLEFRTRARVFKPEKTGEKTQEKNRGYFGVPADRRRSSKTSPSSSVTDLVNRSILSPCKERVIVIKMMAIEIRELYMMCDIGICCCLALVGSPRAEVL